MTKNNDSRNYVLYDCLFDIDIIFQQWFKCTEDIITLNESGLIYREYVNFSLTSSWMYLAIQLLRSREIGPWDVRKYLLQNIQSLQNGCYGDDADG